MSEESPLSSTSADAMVAPAIPLQRDADAVRHRRATRHVIIRKGHGCETALNDMAFLINFIGCSFAASSVFARPAISQQSVCHDAKRGTI